MRANNADALPLPRGQVLKPARFAVAGILLGLVELRLSNRPDGAVIRRLLPAPSGTSGSVKMRPTRKAQTVVMMMTAVMPVMPVMMSAPVVMPVTMVAVPSVVAHLHDASLYRPRQPRSRTKVGGFRRSRGSHKQSKAQGQSEYDSPEHAFLLRHRPGRPMPWNVRPRNSYPPRFREASGGGCATAIR